MKVQIYVNPYEETDFDSCGHYDGEFHVHPNYHENFPGPADIIDYYYEREYDVLCVQPKWDFVQPWPWTEISEKDVEEDGWGDDRDPVDLDMVAVQGCEIEGVEHLINLYSDFMGGDHPGAQTRYQRARTAIEYESDSLVYLGHPSRYSEADEWEQYVIEYRNLGSRFLGLELLNRGFSDDARDLWDNLLTHFAPRRNIYGTAVDDPNDLDDNNADTGRTVFLIDEETWEPGHETGSVREAWIEGRTYWTTVEESGMEIIRIETVDHDENSGELTVKASNYDEVVWIADGETIHEDETLDYENQSDEINGYIRAEFRRYDNEAKEAAAGTQPFLTAPVTVRTIEK